MEADERQPEVQFAEPLIEVAAGELGEPEVDARIGGEHDGAEKYVVEVRHQKVAVPDMEVDGGLASITPVRPPNRNVTMKPTANNIGVSKVMAPRHMCRSS